MAVSKVGALPDMSVLIDPTATRGSKADGRRTPRTGRTYNYNIRADKAVCKEADALASKLGLTRGAFFEKCYGAFKKEQGSKDAFFVNGMVTLEKIAQVESKRRGELVTPEKLLNSLLVERMKSLDMPIEKVSKTR